MDGEVNPLICSPSPRNIPEWIQCWSNLGDYADRYIAKYYPEKQAYKHLYDYFMDHSNYTHMVILPDDLIVKAWQFRILRFDAIYNNLPVVAGVFNRNWQDRNLWSCVVKGRNPPAWMTLKEIEEAAEKKGDILEVRQDYFGCTFIRRDIVKEIGEFHGTPHSGFDHGFSLDCAKHLVPMWCDTRVQLLHLANRKGDGTQEYCGLGKCTPWCEFFPKR